MLLVIFMKFILVQNSAIWQDSKQTIYALEKILRGVGPLLSPGSCLLLPEMFNTGFVTESDYLLNHTQLVKDQEDTLDWMSAFAFNHQMYVLGTIPYWGGQSLTNRMFVIGDQHEEALWYDKRHLFGIAGEKTHFKPGEKRVIWHKNGIRINLSICYDLRFPVWLRNRGDYDVLICLANWPLTRALAWKAMLVSRAIENQCYVIGVNRVGIDGTDTAYGGGSLVVGPDGHVLVELDDREGCCHFEPDMEFLAKYRRAYPFLQDADKFSLI
jgi:predicted amidohydrolase